MTKQAALALAVAMFLPSCAKTRSEARPDAAASATSAALPPEISEDDGGLSPAGRLAVGASHTCAISRKRQATCWGSNRVGQIGTPTEPFHTRPTPVPNVPMPVRAVSSSANRTCAIVSGGRVFCWGEIAYASPASEKTMAREVKGLSGAPLEIAVGNDHACVLLRRGTVACWGKNEHGQLASSGGDTDVPTSVELEGVAVELAAANAQTCARLQSGAVECWGYNQFGQLGAPGADRRIPARVAGIENASSIALGYHHGCAVVGDGAVACWGRNDGAQATGRPSPEPVASTRVEGVVNAKRVVAGGDLSCALLADGKVQCWGRDLNGNMGPDAPKGEANTTPPHLMAGIAGARSIAAAFATMCADTSGSGILCWGETFGGARTPKAIKEED